MKVINTSRNIMLVGLIILILDEPLAIFTKVGSIGDRIAGVIFGVAFTLIILPLYFDFTPRVDNKDTKDGEK